MLDEESVMTFTASVYCTVILVKVEMEGMCDASSFDSMSEQTSTTSLPLVFIIIC